MALGRGEKAKRGKKQSPIRLNSLKSDGGSGRAVMVARREGRARRMGPAERWVLKGRGFSRLGMRVEAFRAALLPLREKVGAEGGRMRGSQHELAGAVDSVA